MADKLTEDAITEGLQGSLWERDGEAIVRDWTFADFKEAMVWVNRIAEVAEEANHHPDILIHGWNKVRLSLLTHDKGEITDSDHALATKIDDLA